MQRMTERRLRRDWRVRRDSITGEAGVFDTDGNSVTGENYAAASLARGALDIAIAHFMAQNG